MSLGPILLLREDRPHPRVMFCSAEGIFSESDVGGPQGLRICPVPVGAENVAAPGFKCPLIALGVLPDVNRKAAIFFCNDNGEERSGPAVSFEQPSDLPFHFLPVPDLPLIGPLGKLNKLLFGPGHTPVEDGILFFLPSGRTAENKGLSFR